MRRVSLRVKCSIEIHSRLKKRIAAALSPVKDNKKIFVIEKKFVDFFLSISKSAFLCSEMKTMCSVCRISHKWITILEMLPFRDMYPRA